MAAELIIGRRKGWMKASSLMPPKKIEKLEEDIELKNLLDSVDRRDNLHLIEECRQYFDALGTFRAQRERCKRYATGDQWGDIIMDPDTDQPITEGDYIKKQGKVPLKNNVITPLIKSILGIYRGNKKEPIAICRDRDEAKLGDMMSIAMQYAYQINKTDELNARHLQDTINSGLFCSSVNYEWNDDRKRYEVYVKNEPQDRVFFNGDVDDVRMDDLRLVGFIRDLTLDEVIQKFSSSQMDSQRIRDEYRYVTSHLGAYVESLNRRQKVTNFYVPQDTNKCRVIECWTKETKERLRCHDTMKGETFVCELVDRGEIDRINEERKAQYVAEGMTEEDAPLIVAEWFIDRYWYVRYMTPLGAVLAEKRSPFWHGSHPYVIRAFPMIDGEIHSFTSEVLDQQRFINRYITMMDYIIGASAKGVLLVPDGSLPENMKMHDLIREWSKPDSAIVYKWKPGMPEPHHIAGNGLQSGMFELLNLEMQMVEQTSGVHSAMQGQAPNASTPASLYAQQAQNASNNLTDFLSWFDGCVADRDYKLMKTIQQYYTERKYQAIAGHDYDEESKWYDPEKVRDSEFDIAINEATATPAYRNIMNDFLMQMFQSGAIDSKMFLENVNMPFAPKLLEAVKRKEEEMAQQQQMLEAQQAAIAQGGGAAMPDQAAPVENPDGGIATQEEAMDTTRAMNNPKVMSLINSSLEQKQ